MSVLPPEIDFRVDKAASPERMNRATTHIDARLRTLEAYKPGFDRLLAELQIFGLQRVNEAVGPLLQELGRVQALGFLNAPIQPGTTASFAAGQVSVTISEDRRNVFTPSPWIMLVSDSVPDSYVLGKKLSYDQESGELQINVTNQWGANALLADVTVWGVAGGALSALESATKAVDAKVAAQTASATAVSAAATISGSTTTAVSAAQTASNAANNAATSAAQAAASAASISNGPVLSVNMRTGAITLAASDVGAYATSQVDSLLGAKLSASANLSDLANAASARGNLGLATVAASGSAADLASGTLPAARLPMPTTGALGGVKSASAAAHQFQTGIDANGAPTFAQPAANDVSGLAASATTDATNASNISSGTLAAARGGAGAVNGVMKANGSGAVSAATAGTDYLAPGTTATLTVGFKVTPYNIGTPVAASTVTLDPANGNYQYLTNNAAFTLAAPASDCAIDILVTNGASAGAITLSGFAAPSGGGGDSYATTNANKYLLMIRRINSIATYSWKSLQ